MWINKINKNLRIIYNGPTIMKVAFFSTLEQRAAYLYTTSKILHLTQSNHWFIIDLDDNECSTVPRGSSTFFHESIVQYCRTLENGRRVFFKRVSFIPILISVPNLIVYHYAPWFVCWALNCLARTVSMTTSRLSIFYLPIHSWFDEITNRHIENGSHHIRYLFT